MYGLYLTMLNLKMIVQSNSRVWKTGGPVLLWEPQQAAALLHGRVNWQAGGGRGAAKERAAAAGGGSS